MATGLDGLMLVYAGDPLPEGPSVFLAGPTPRSADVPSWRPGAIRELAAQWRGPERLAVLIPEPSGRQWLYHDNQAEWETVSREAATAILFWIPRDLIRQHRSHQRARCAVASGRSSAASPRGTGRRPR